MAVNEFNPPVVLNDTDVDTIHARMIADLPENIDQTEGGFAWDMTRPSAIEKSYCMLAMISVLKLMFPDWAEGEYLDLHARRSGTSRKAAVAATGTIHVTGTSAITLAKGTIVCTPATPISSSIRYLTTAEATLEVDEVDITLYAADIPVICEEPGFVGNVGTGSITLMSTPVSGITGVTNAAPTEGGADEETDDELRERIIEIERTRIASYVGNNNDYIRWAKEVEGVGGASVIPEWAGAGTGTVKVLVLDSNGEPASSTLITKVYNHIMGTQADGSDRLAPIGAILTVDTATALALSVAAEVTLAEGYTTAMVQETFAAAVATYLIEAKEDGVLRYTRVGRLLSNTAGVVDYRNLYINSARANITIDVDDYPTVTSLTITEAT